MCVSERFRKQFLFVLKKIWIHKHQQLLQSLNKNQVVPQIEVMDDRQRVQINTVAVDVISIH